MTSLQHEIGPRRADGIPRGRGYGCGVSGLGTERGLAHAGGIPRANAALRSRPRDGRVTVMREPQASVAPSEGGMPMAVDPAAGAAN